MRKIFYSVFSLFLAVLLSSCFRPKSEVIDLSGEWQLSIDSTDIQPRSITLPGILDTTVVACGAAVRACYTRTFEVPDHLAGKPLQLMLERVSWQSVVFIDGELLLNPDLGGGCLSAPHLYELPQGLRAGRHNIRIYVDNRLLADLARPLSGNAFVSWNGILGAIELRALPSVSVDVMEVYPNETFKQLDVVVQVNNRTEQPQPAYLMLLTSTRGAAEIWYSSPVEETVDPGVTTLTLSCNLPSHAPRWTAQNPDLLNVSVSLEGHDGIIDSTIVTGLRHVSMLEDKLLVNGGVVELRDTLESALLPASDCPPLDKASWERILGQARQWGLNHVRFTKYCPPEAAFQVADEMGIYFTIDRPHSEIYASLTSITYYAFQQEYERIIRFYGNHPSFLRYGITDIHPDGLTSIELAFQDAALRDPRHLIYFTMAKDSSSLVP